MTALSRWVIQVLVLSWGRELDEMGYNFYWLKDSLESDIGCLDIPKRDKDTFNLISSLLSQERMNAWLDQSPYRQVSPGIVFYLS